MTSIRRVVLDVLKPHQPNVLEFAKVLAEQYPGCNIQITVTEMDDKTETTLVDIEGDDIPYDGIVDAIQSLGASVHSIDQVEVYSTPE
jgi:hypothetical protein